MQLHTHFMKRSVCGSQYVAMDKFVLLSGSYFQLHELCLLWGFVGVTQCKLAVPWMSLEMYRSLLFINMCTRVWSQINVTKMYGNPLGTFSSVLHLHSFINRLINEALFKPQNALCEYKIKLYTHGCHYNTLLAQYCSYNRLNVLLPSNEFPLKRFERCFQIT